MNNSTKSIKNLGVFSILLSIFFFLICVGIGLIFFLLKKMIDDNSGSFVVIFLIILAIGIGFILSIVGIILLILGILNLITGITIIKNSSSVDAIYEKKGRIKFSIFTLRITGILLFAACILLVFALIKSFTIIYLIAAIASLALSVISFMLVKKSNETFKAILIMKENEEK